MLCFQADIHFENLFSLGEDLFFHVVVLFSLRHPMTVSFHLIPCLCIWSLWLWRFNIYCWHVLLSRKPKVDLTLLVKVTKIFFQPFSELREHTTSSSLPVQKQTLHIITVSPHTEHAFSIASSLPQ